MLAASMKRAIFPSVALASGKPIGRGRRRMSVGLTKSSPVIEFALRADSSTLRDEAKDAPDREFIE